MYPLQHMHFLTCCVLEMKIKCVLEMPQNPTKVLIDNVIFKIIHLNTGHFVVNKKTSLITLVCARAEN